MTKHAETIIVIAQSGRQLAAAAREAGVIPLVIDRFGDTDTCAAAGAVRIVAGGGGSLCENEVRTQVAEWRVQFPGAPVVWGGGMEAQVDLLASLACDGALLGSDLAALRILRCPDRLARELAVLRVPMPAIAQRAQLEHGWLRKRCAAAGGWHVQPYTPGTGLAADEYLQRAVSGQSYSYTFLITDSILTLSFNQMLNLQPCATWPFRYGGAVAGAQLPVSVRTACAAFAKRIARHFGWRGLCGFDFVYDGSDLAVVDLNPRPTATFGLAYTAASAFSAHLAACRRMPLPPLVAHPDVRGHLVCYATDAIQIPHALDSLAGSGWPSWTADRPRAGSFVPAGAPVCSIEAATGEVTDTIALLKVRLAAWSQWFAAAAALAP